MNAKVEIDLRMPGVQAWRMSSDSNSGSDSDTDTAAYLLVDLGKPALTLNSSPWGGGFGRHPRLLNRQVDKDYDSEDPQAEMREFLIGQRLDPQATACMMTAARVADAASETAEHGATRVTALVTAGFGNKARAGLSLPQPRLYPGTINAIVLVRGGLTEAAMVNAVITATEAKAAALQELDERVAPEAMPEGGEPPPHATGTSTDAVLIAALGDGPLSRYAGTATEVGYLIGRTVYDATVAAGRRYQAYVRARQFRS